MPEVSGEDATHQRGLAHDGQRGHQAPARCRLALERLWYQAAPPPWGLRALSGLFKQLVALRRAAYRRGLLASCRVSCPVIVVGNVVVGGTGKTPLTAWIAQHLHANGLRPGIICRGYRGQSRTWPRRVRTDSDPAEVGDEAVLLARQTGLPVAAGPDRVRSAERLIRDTDCNVLISDDGLQHYRLRRDLEIAVVDGHRRHGNGYMLPAGPLREPVSRLREVDMVVVNGECHRRSEYAMTLSGSVAFSLSGGDHSYGSKRLLKEFVPGPVHAVCGLGNPARFFRHLESHGLEIIAHPFPDHHRFVRSDFDFPGAYPVLMTEKDAVKCRGLGLDGAWSVPVAAHLTSEFRQRFDVFVQMIKGETVKPITD